MMLGEDDVLKICFSFNLFTCPGLKKTRNFMEKY